MPTITLRICGEFKENICMLNTALSRRKRLLMAQLIIGKLFDILPLHIGTASFRNKRTDERVCLICNSGEVENELHLLYLYYLYSIHNNDNF